MKRDLIGRGIALLIFIVIIVSVPAAATNVVVYGSTLGFLPDRHTSDMTVVYTLPGFSGGLFDQDVDLFTDPSVDIIFIGNDDEFSASTATAIEQAVYEGKVLVVGHPSIKKFDDSLPVTSGNVAKGSPSLVVGSLSSGITKDVFNGLNKTYTAVDPVAERMTGTLKPGAIALLKFNTGEPALAYRAYGNGFVAEWLLPTPETYLGVNDADTINYRVMNILLATVKGSNTPVPTTTIPTTVITTAPTGKPTTEKTTGNAIIQSSPLGASVFFDGTYQGKTPLELENIPSGYHSVKMTRDGYIDFDGSAYIISGETITVFGSLPVQEKPTTIEKTVVATTPAPAVTTPAPTPTASATDALANPTVIAAGIGIITAGIGAYATIYTHKSPAQPKEGVKEEPKKKE